MKPMAMATSMSSARTRSGKVGPMMTLTTVSSSATAEHDERCSQRPVEK